MKQEAIEKAILNLPKGSKKGRKVVKMNAMSNAKLMAALLEEKAGLTYQEMIDVSGLSYTVVKEYIHCMRKENCAYIAAWVEDGRGGRTRKQWALGTEKKDAPRPGAKCAKTRAVTYRARKSQAKMLGIMRTSAQGAA